MLREAVLKKRTILDLAFFSIIISFADLKGRQIVKLSLDERIYTVRTVCSVQYNLYIYIYISKIPLTISHQEQERCYKLRGPVQNIMAQKPKIVS